MNVNVYEVTFKSGTDKFVEAQSYKTITIGEGDTQAYAFYDAQGNLIAQYDYASTNGVSLKQTYDPDEPVAPRAPRPKSESQRMLDKY